MSRSAKNIVPIIAGLGLTGAMAFFVGIAIDQYWLRMIAKPLPVLAMATAVAAVNRQRYGVRIFAGLVFCLLGDVLLEASAATFLYGVGAFFAGHLCYIAAFWGEDRTLRPVAALIFGAWGAAVVLVLLPGLREQGMAIPVAVYTLAIAVMMWRAAARWRPGSGPPVAYAATGAMLFGISDSMIAVNRFGEPLAGVRYWIILLYWLGQLGIAASAVLNPAARRRSSGSAP